MFNPWLVAVVVTMGAFVEVLDTSIANVALPHIAGSLAASQDESSWVLTSYLVANAIVLPVSGWISTALGRTRFYIASVSFFTVFSALCGVAPSMGVLVLFRVLQGFAGGGLQPSVQAILADAFPPTKRGMAMSLYTMAILVAPVLGPTLGGWITDNYSWRWIFYINIPVGLACVFLSRFMLQDPAHLIAKRTELLKQGLRIDWTGLGFLSVGLASLELVLDKGQELDWFGSHLIAAGAVIAAVCIIAALLWEWWHEAPIVNVRLLRERNFFFCCMLILLLYAVLYSTTFLLPQFMQGLMGYTATTAGMVLSPAGIVTMVEIPLIGYVLTKGADPRKMVFLGLVVVGGSLYWMSTLNLQIAEVNLILPRIVQVLGVAVITVPISTIIFRFLPNDQTSNAAGIYALVRNEGGSIGIAASSTMLQRGAQIHQNILVTHTTAPAISAYLGHLANATSNAGEISQVGLARVYAVVLQQATLLSYMDQFRMLAGMTFCLLPLVFFLKRASKGQKVEVGHME